MEVDFKPSAFGEKFDGTIKLIVPSFDDRFEYMEVAGLKINQDGNIEYTSDYSQMIRKLVGFSKKFYKSVEVKNKQSGVEYKSFEDMACDVDCDPILIEVATKIRTGFRPDPK